MPPRRSIQIASVSLENEAAFPVTQVELSVPKRQRSLELNQIPAGAESSYGFPVREYQGNSLRLSWMLQGRSYVSEDLRLQIPKPLPEGELNARIQLREGRWAEISLEPLSALEARLQAMRKPHP